MQRQYRSERLLSDDPVMTISARVIDSVHGGPAVQVSVRLEQHVNGLWTEVAASLASVDGLVENWSPKLAAHPQTGIYKLVFDTGRYFAALGIKPLYPEVLIIFTLSDPSKDYDHTLMLAPHAYAAFHSVRRPSGAR